MKIQGEEWRVEYEIIEDLRLFGLYRESEVCINNQDELSCGVNEIKNHLLGFNVAEIVFDAHRIGVCVFISFT